MIAVQALLNGAPAHGEDDDMDNGGKGKRKLEDGASSSSSSSSAKKQKKAAPEKPARDDSSAEVGWFCVVLFDLFDFFSHMQDQDRFDIGLSYLRKIADGMEQLKKGQGELIKLQKVRSFALSASCADFFCHAQKLSASKVRAALAGVKATDAAAGAKVCGVGCCLVCVVTFGMQQDLEDPYEGDSDEEDGEKHKQPKDPKDPKDSSGSKGSKSRLGGHAGVAAEAAAASGEKRKKKGKGKGKKGAFVVRACVCVLF